MSERNEQQNIDSIRNDLIKSITICDERIRISRENEQKFIALSQQKATADQLLSNARDTANHMNRMYKNIKFFLENKKTNSKNILESAIHSVSAIVQDSDLQGCTIQHKNGKTRILNEKGQSINLREGSAARATMGFILRYTCLKALPNKIQIMFLDEALATLSSSTSMNLRELLEAFSQNVGIVGIEQRDILYNGLATKRYKAVKVGDVSTIHEEMIK